MKLFQRLLVAPAALGLLAPLAANAAEVTIDDVANYATPGAEVTTAQFSDVVPGDWAYTALQNLSESYGCVENDYTQSLKNGQALTRYEAAALVNACLESGVASAEVNDDASRLANEFGTEMAILKGRVDGLEYKVKELSAGQFSSSTKMSGGAQFVLGAIDGNSTGKTAAEYNFTLDLNTSFTGEDGLYTQLVSGNQDENVLDGAETSTSKAVEVQSLFYSFPIGDFQVTAGPLLDQDDVISATYSVYSQSFRLSQMPWSAIGTTGAGAAVAWANDSGFNATFSNITTEADAADASKGLWSEESTDTTTVAVGYDANQWGGGLIYTANDGANTESADYTTLGVGAYYRPDGFPTISVVYDTKDYDGATVNDGGSKKTVHDGEKLLIGLDYPVWGGTASAAYQKDNDQGVGGDNFELYYDYPINDGVSVKAGIFVEGDAATDYERERSLGTGVGTNQIDRTGYMVETTFTF
jgi:hypothetical protein